MLKYFLIFTLIVKTCCILHAIEYKNDHVFYEALRFVESSDGLKLIGDGRKAIGVYQLHKIYIDDVNRIYGTTYSHADRWDKSKSHEIVILYLSHYRKVFEKKYKRPINVVELAAIHNGGPQGYRNKKALNYGRKVLKYINKKNEVKNAF